MRNVPVCPLPACPGFELDEDGEGWWCVDGDHYVSPADVRAWED